MSDLQERLARALPGWADRSDHDAYLFYSVAWWRCRRCGEEWYYLDGVKPYPEAEADTSAIPPVCKRNPPVIDWPIVPEILADIEKRGWKWSKYQDGLVIIYGNDGPECEHLNKHLPTALVQAYVEAVEGQQ